MQDTVLPHVKQQTIRPETALHNDVFITVEPVSQTSHETVLDLLQANKHAGSIQLTSIFNYNHFQCRGANANIGLNSIVLKRLK